MGFSACIWTLLVAGFGYTFMTVVFETLAALLPSTKIHEKDT